MAKVTLTWEEFLKEAKEFKNISDKINDDWNIIKHNDMVGSTHLRSTKKMRTRRLFPAPDVDCKDEIPKFVDKSAAWDGDAFDYLTLLVTYDVVYSINYQVPMIIVTAKHFDGRTANLEDIWSILGLQNMSVKDSSREQLLQIISPSEHPIYFKPCFQVHPCKTSELLGQIPNSRNRVLTFLSVLGPMVKLGLDNSYGLVTDPKMYRNEKGEIALCF